MAAALARRPRELGVEVHVHRAGDVPLLVFGAAGRTPERPADVK